MDDTTYDKRAKYNPGHGYEARKNAPISIVCHSTSNPRAKNTVFSAEATFLYNSTLVSAHYLIGKDGATVRFLEPRAWAAWHAGNAQREYQNQYSIGVELHHSVGDPPYPKAQMNALAVLLRSLMALFNIPVTRIETHGQIAIAGPYIRKSDPSDMTYEAFLQFRSTLVSEPTPVSPPKPPPQTPPLRRKQSHPRKQKRTRCLVSPSISRLLASGRYGGILHKVSRWKLTRRTQAGLVISRMGVALSIWWLWKKHSRPG